MNQRKLKVFLCHASQDKLIAHELYQKLAAEGWIEPWLDAKKLLPGQDWQAEIKNAVKTADNVIIFLSNTSINKDGFIQKELRLAKDVALEKAEGSIFLIPLRIEDCESPRSLNTYQWANYFGEEQEQTYEMLLESLRLRLKDLEQKDLLTKKSKQKSKFPSQKGSIQSTNSSKNLDYVFKEGPGLEGRIAEYFMDISHNEGNNNPKLQSQIAFYYMAAMHAIADEAKNGPRLFTFREREVVPSLKKLFSYSLELQLWCEAEGCQHPVTEAGKGIYPINIPREWLVQIAPYANLALKILGIVVPMGTSAVNTFFGSKTTETWMIADQLDLAKVVIDKLPPEAKTPDSALPLGNMLIEPERSGILALHRFLNEIDPTQENLGLHRVATYTGDFRWLCKRHYDAYQPNIPDVIPTPNH